MLIPTDRAAYRILAVEGFFGPDDHLYREGDCIVFDGTPNEEMEPLNDIAKERLRLYSDMLDEEAKKAAEKAGRRFAARPRSRDGLIATASADARAVQLISGGPGIPLMKGQKHGPAIERLGEPEIPETGIVSGEPPRKRGRPRKSGSLSLSAP